MIQNVVQPYLFFSGRCEEALEFYRTTLGAEVTMLTRFKDNPEPSLPGMEEPGMKEKIMHATFRVGASTMMASDGGFNTETPAGFALALMVPGEAEAERAFSALAEGGRIEMPLGKTFWSPCFGMLTDRFGISWTISVMP